jgi:hypothetical protein
MSRFPGVRHLHRWNGIAAAPNDVLPVRRLGLFGPEKVEPLGCSMLEQPLPGANSSA